MGYSAYLMNILVKYLVYSQILNFQHLNSLTTLYNMSFKTLSRAISFIAAKIIVSRSDPPPWALAFLEEIYVMRCMASLAYKQFMFSSCDKFACCGFVEYPSLETLRVNYFV